MISSLFLAVCGNACAEKANEIGGDIPARSEIGISEERNVFLPDGYYLLSQKERSVYDSIASAFEEYGDEADIIPENMTPDEVKKAYQLMYSEDSRFFYIADHYDYYTDESGNVTRLRLRYDIPPEYAAQMEERLEKYADNILSGITPEMSGYEKAAYIHDSLAAVCEYKAECFQGDNAYGAIVRGEGICQGYARGFAYLCGRAGIASGPVDGYADGEAHMWNKFELDGEILYADITRDDKGDTVSRKYFGLDAEQMSSLGYEEK